MRYRSFVCAALLAVYGMGRSQDQQPDTLLSYIASLKWDAAAKGPLLAIEPGQVTAQNEELQSLEGVSRLGKRLVKVGAVSTFAPTTRDAEPDASAKTALDHLDVNLKIAALLANLTDSEFERLNQSGLSASDLNGDARIAMLSLIPEQTDTFETYHDQDGNQTQSDSKTISADDRVKIKLQLCRGVHVSLQRKIDENSYEGGPTFTSVDVQLPVGVNPLHSQALEFEGSPDQSRQVEAFEKPYKFDWQDKRLAQPFELKPDEPIGELVDRIRNSSKIEIYADARIARFKVHCIGAVADCASVLHGLAVAADGVFRPVGPAFVLVGNLEGEGTAAARIAGQEFLARRQMEPLITDYIHKIGARSLFKRIAFLADDQLAHALYPNGPPNDETSVFDVHPISSLPQILQTRAQQKLSEPDSNSSGHPGKFDMADVHIEIIPRWIFPDGRTVVGNQLDGLIDTLPGEQNSQPEHTPLDVSNLKPGSAAKISPPDAASATTMVKTLLACGFKEIWIDSTDPSVVAAATQAGGGHIDLVIRPWRPLKTETLANPDLDILGLTGSQVANLPQGRLQQIENIHAFTNTFLPTDPNLGQHWSRLIAFIPKSGIRRVIVLDPEVGGYGVHHQDDFLGGVSYSVDDNQFSFGSLMGTDPAVNDFGYTLDSRLNFVRANHVDPIDLIPQMEANGQIGLGETMEVGLPGGSIFQNNNETSKYLTIWRAKRFQSASSVFANLKDQLQALPYDVCIQSNESQTMFTPTSSQVVIVIDGKKALVDWHTVSPAYSEDANGNLVESLEPFQFENGPICIDLQVSGKDFDRYVKYFFAVPKPSAPKAGKPESAGR